MTIAEMMDRGLRNLFEQAKTRTNPPAVWGMYRSERGSGGYVQWLPDDIRWQL